MRLLFVGNADNPLLVDLALELKRVRLGAVIDILSERASRHPQAREAFDSVHSLRTGSRWSTVRGIKFFWFLFAYRKMLRSIDGGYDAVHVFYLSGVWGVLSKAIARKGRRLIVSLFGSDVYRTTPLMRPLQGRLLERASIITAANQDTLDVADRSFPIATSERRIVRFGLRPLDHLQNMISIHRWEHKKALGIAGERIVIVAGYNASPRQYHLRIIAALHGLPDAERGRLIVILPMTMGGSSRYVEEVRAACIGSGMEHRIITDLMSDEDVARLRCATDIMVQVQPTDQLSGAMQEHLFAGTVVLTGAWLPYGVLCEAGVRFWTIPDRSALQEGIMECLNELGSRARLASANATAIHELSSWERNAPHWSALYD